MPFLFLKYIIFTREDIFWIKGRIQKLSFSFSFTLQFLDLLLREFKWLVSTSSLRILKHLPQNKILPSIHCIGCYKKAKLVGVFLRPVEEQLCCCPVEV